MAGLCNFVRYLCGFDCGVCKVGVRDISSNLATTIRTAVIMLLVWGIVLSTHELSGIKNVPRNTWLFLVLSGLSTGFSWLFYFKAIQLGELSRVAPIDKLSVVITMGLAFLLFGETPRWNVLFGGLLIAAGSVLILVK